MLLTIDLGTSATKAAVWGENGMVAVGRGRVPTFHPEPGWAEQDPSDWWSSTVHACSVARAASPDAWDAISAIGFAAARETFVPVSAGGAPLGLGLLWSDRRAAAEALDLSGRADGTGVVVDAGATVAKVAWLAAHDPDRLLGARWLLSPRDLLVLRMTGEVLTDRTLASRTGFHLVTGDLAPHVEATVVERLPPVRPSATVAGELGAEAAAVLELPAGLPVVLGAGDRPCEVLGTGATAERPMVSWGTTTNVSVPVAAPPSPLPDRLAVSAGALDGWLVEAGLSASGAAMSWLSQLTGTSPLDLAEAAARSRPGARGVVALPWLNGARAPWWRPGARAAFLNMTPAHGAGDLARAVYEAVAYDVARSLEAMAATPDALAAAGGGAASAMWVDLLAAVTRLPVVLRRSGEAASAGACLVTASAVGLDWELDRINPVVSTTPPDPSLVARYFELRPLSDRVAATVVGLDLSEWSTE